MRTLLNAPIVLLLGSAIGACVGDSTAPSNGNDASTPDTSVADTSVQSEAGADAADAADAAPPCDLSKPFGAATLIPGVNSAQDEGVPRILPDELTVYFSSTRPGGLGLSDIWSASRSTRNAAFDPPTLVGGVNTAANEIEPSPNGTQLLLVFASDRNNAVKIWTGSRASTVAPFGGFGIIPGIDTTAGYSNPFLRADESELWFIQITVNNGHDIYRAPKSGGSFANPVAVNELNTPSKEWYPTLTADALTIYWASNRGDGSPKGGFDIWVAHRTMPTGPFGTASNVAELNTADNEYPGSISPDGCRMYFGSDRPGGVGGGDMYVASKP
jgi:hypothetical protein